MCPLAARAAGGHPGGHAADHGRRQRPASLRRPGGRAARHHRKRRHPRRAADGDIPSGAAEPDRHQRRTASMPDACRCWTTARKAISVLRNTSRRSRRSNACSASARTPDASLPVGEPLMDIQVLAPMKKGPLGRIQPQHAPSGGAETRRRRTRRSTPLASASCAWGTRSCRCRTTTRSSGPGAGPNGASIEGAGAFNGDLGTVYRIDNGARRFSILF